MKKTLPTAAQFLNQDQELILDVIDGKLSYSIVLNILQNKLIEFAALHVEAALEAASKVHIKVQKKSQHGKYKKWQTVKEGEEVDLFKYDMHYSADKKSILNAYPIENIK